MRSAVLALLAHLPISAACTYDVHCSLNGRCDAGACTCYAGWKGTSCATLDLLPAPTVAAYGGGIGGNVSSWGAGVMRDPSSGTYVMYLDEITRGCGLGAWQPNSHCVVATSENALGPYTRVKALQAAWCHGSSLVRDPVSQTYFFGHMSHATRGASCKQCANGTTPGGAASGPCDADTDALPYSATAFSAPGPLGPFSPVANYINCGNGEAFFSADGSVVMACPEGGATSDSFLAVSSAPSATAAIAGNWTRLPQTLSVAGSNVTVPYIGFHWEDQTIYRDPRGYYHAVMHAWRGQNSTLPAPGCIQTNGVWLPANCTSLGGHAFSIDASHWWISTEPAYTAYIEFEDGTSAQMRARERPHFLLGDDGEIAFFLSGVGDPGQGGNTGVAGADHSFTLVQALRGGTARSAAAEPVSTGGSSAPSVATLAPSPGFLNAVTDCGADPSGAVDSTAQLQACVDRAYARTVPRVPVFLPRGVYLLNDTLTLAQTFSGPDDGINVCPSRYLPHIFFGEPAGASGVRPTLRLAPSSPGFAETAYKPLVKIYNPGGEGIDMNNVFKGVDIDLQSEGNSGAVGISHPGAQGATVTDVTVTAAPGVFACFAGLNGAGGIHANIKCVGARYGLYIDDSQPVPVAVSATLINQTISAIYFASQETLSLVGATIVLAPGATGAAIVAADHGMSTETRGMSIIDTTIECASPTSVAISTNQSVYLRDVYVRGCAYSVARIADAPALPCMADGAWTHVIEYAATAPVSPYYVPSIYLSGVREPAGSYVSRTETVASPPADVQSRHIWDESTFPDKGAPGVADARDDCGASGDGETDDTSALQACLTSHVHVFLPPGIFRVSDTLLLPPGGSLVGMGNGASYIAAASAGLPLATAAAPAPLVRTATDDAPGAAATIIAHIGIVTWYVLIPAASARRAARPHHYIGIPLIPQAAPAVRHHARLALAGCGLRLAR